MKKSRGGHGAKVLANEVPHKDHHQKPWKKADLATSSLPEECPFVPAHKEFLDTYTGTISVKVSLQALCQESYNNFRRSTLVWEFWFHIVLYGLLALQVSLQAQGLERHQTISAVRDIFEKTKFPVSPLSNTYKTFPEISSQVGFSQWLLNVVFPTFKKRHISSTILNLSGTWLLWGTEFMSYQVQSVPCQFGSIPGTTASNTTCFPPFDTGNQVIYQKNATGIPGALPIVGHHAAYPAVGDSRLMLLNATEKVLEQSAVEIQSSDFLNQGTRAIVASSTFYNPSYNILLSTQYLVEFPNGGGTTATSIYRSGDILASDTKLDSLKAGMGILCSILSLFFIAPIVNEIKHIARLHRLSGAKRIKYRYLLWLCMDFGILYLLGHHIYYSVQRTYDNQRAKETIEANEFSREIDTILERYEAMQVKYGTLLVALALRGLKYLQVFPVFSGFILAAQHASGPLLYFSIILVLFSIPLGVFFHLMFGHISGGHDTFLNSVFSIFLTAAGDHNQELAHHTNQLYAAVVSLLLFLLLLFAFSTFNGILLTSWLVHGRTHNTKMAGLGWIGSEIGSFLLHPKRKYCEWRRNWKNHTRMRRLKRNWLTDFDVYTRLLNFKAREGCAGTSLFGFTDLRSALQLHIGRKKEIHNSQVESLFWDCRQHWKLETSENVTGDSDKDSGKEVVTAQEQYSTTAVIHEQFATIQENENNQRNEVFSEIEKITNTLVSCRKVLASIDELLLKSSN